MCNSVKASMEVLTVRRYIPSADLLARYVKFKN